MQFIRLEYLDDRQDTDFEILKEEIQKKAIEAGVESDVIAGTEDDVGGDTTKDSTISAGAAEEVSDNRVLYLREGETSQTESLFNKSSN